MREKILQRFVFTKVFYMASSITPNMNQAQDHTTLFIQCYLISYDIKLLKLPKSYIKFDIHP